MPHEFTLGEVYFPPLLVATFVAYLISNVITALLARAGAYRFVAIPAIFELSIFALITMLIGLYIPYI
ncbi:DUF1656 domain-containing protein [Vibrio parahaemolyticus]|uniref:DUF1656 domain-containing protein n=1 Tax=Vibrio mediterranei TaxID=689 RepID=UPI004068BCB4